MQNKLRVEGRGARSRVTGQVKGDKGLTEKERDEDKEADWRNDKKVKRAKGWPEGSSRNYRWMVVKKGSKWSVLDK